MEFAITTGLIVLAAVALVLFVARRVLRLALKFAFVAVFVLLLVAAAAFGWWRGWFDRESQRTERPPSQSNQRPNLNRRPSSR
jgi:uncharacterized membrane protein YwaF